MYISGTTYVHINLTSPLRIDHANKSPTDDPALSTIYIAAAELNHRTTQLALPLSIDQRALQLYRPATNQFPLW